MHFSFCFTSIGVVVRKLLGKEWRFLVRLGNLCGDVGGEKKSCRWLAVLVWRFNNVGGTTGSMFASREWRVSMVECV